MKFFSLIITLLILSCTVDEFAGPTTEQGNPQITALVLDSLSNPVPDIVATLLVIPQTDTSEGYDSLVPPGNAIKVNTSKSSQDGKCFFSNLASGSYRIVAIDNERNMSVISENITVKEGNDTSIHDTLVLKHSGSIKGTVIRDVTLNNQNLQNGIIQIRMLELDRYTVTVPSGHYSFDSLPCGRYTLYYYATDYYVEHVENITVTPGKTTLIDTVVLRRYKDQLLVPPTNFQAQYDTANGTVTLSWSPVTIQNFKYYKLERHCDEQENLERTWKTTASSFIDTIGTIPDKTVFSYVVYTVDASYVRSSKNAGPIQVQVSKLQK
jgi:hypothetical protein